MRSVEDSLQRLSLPSIDLLVIHDLDLYFYKTEARVNAWLNQLYTPAVGGHWTSCGAPVSSRGWAGINELGLIPKFLELVDLDFVLVAYGYNLLKQDMLDHDFPLCQQHGVSVIVGAVFASGILATGAVPGARSSSMPTPMRRSLPKHGASKRSASVIGGATARSRHALSCSPIRSSLRSFRCHCARTCAVECQAAATTDPSNVLGRAEGRGVAARRAPTP